MSDTTISRLFAGRKTTKFTWSALSLTLIFLLIELFDELHYGIESAALPWLRSDLALTYAQIGLLLGLPKAISTVIELVIMLLGDTRLRKVLVVGGGLAIVLTVLLTANAHSFAAILVAFIIGFPASGAFVTLGQATLMDLNPGREPHMMARWTVFGSLGNLVGPLLMAGGFALGWGWRWAYFGLAIIALGLTLTLLPRRFPLHHKQDDDEEWADFKRLIPNLFQTMRNRRLLRWLTLLEFSDLMLDVFAGYVALYFADVVGLGASQVSVLLSVLMGASLLTDLALIPLLEKIPGRTLVRYSAVVTGIVYIIWLAAPWVWVKVALAVVLRCSTIGWYSVLQGEAYATIPGRSGTVMAINSLAGLLGGALVWLIGWSAERAGLPAAMWLLLLGPVSLALFTPKHIPERPSAQPPM